jgi:tRNA dimethylallyltransferase
VKLVLAILGPTASGKSALALAVAERWRGEVINCDSTAVYRGFDIGTDKVPAASRRRIAHHLLDVAAPSEVYTAAQYARDAATAIREVHGRGKLPIVAGGSGFYYRALTRGLFPGPGADDVVRGRLGRIADLRGVERLHRWLSRVDPASATRIMPRDRKRVVRALEVYLITGIPLTQHFSNTVSPIADCEVLSVALQIPAALTAERVTKRVDEQFERGVIAEVDGLLAAGLHESARPFGGLVYRQVMELRRGLRGEAETRALIAQENRRYARRQLIWFHKEPNVVWVEGPGERPSALALVDAMLEARGARRGGSE